MTNEIPPMKETLLLRLQEETTRFHSERLPGWETFLAGDSRISAYLDDLQQRVKNAIRDADGVRFEKELKSIEKAWNRLNEIVAEDYRKTHEDPNLWDLRFVKWMKIAFIKFGSPRGDFYLVPRMPSRLPKAAHWYTVDEMLTFVRPEIAALLEMSDQLPQRPDILVPPGPGENVLHVDASGPVVKTYYEMYKKPRYG